MYERIVAGTDLSKTARFATEQAATLAKGLSAELVLVHAGSDPGPALEDLAESLGGAAIVAKGNPVDVLLEAAESGNPTLLVVGSVGMSGARRFMLGNVPNKVSHSAHTDLLIVKTDRPKRRCQALFEDHGRNRRLDDGHVGGGQGGRPRRRTRGPSS